MKSQKTRVVLIFLLAAALATAALYGSKRFLIKKVSLFLIEKIEAFTLKGVKITDIGYVPGKGMRFEGVRFYSDISCATEECYISLVYIKFPPLKLLSDRIFSPAITVHGMESTNFSINGTFGFSMKVDKKSGPQQEILKKIERIWFKKISVKNVYIDIEKLNGIVNIAAKAVKTDGISFVLNGESCTLSIDMADPFDDFSFWLKLSSPNINLACSLSKENMLYKIAELRGGILNSSLELSGEMLLPDNSGPKNEKTPVLSLYGKISLETSDVSPFAPDKLKDALVLLKPEGRIESSIYFNGNPENMRDCEVDIKAKAVYLKVRDFTIDDIYLALRLKDGLLEIPVIKARPYGGVLMSSAKLNIAETEMPYEMSCRLGNINITSIIKNTALGDKDIKGFLSSEFALEGDLRDAVSARGSGKIFINNANLGPMPLLTPLLGHLYGYFQHMLPEFKKIDITRGSCNFHVSDRRVMTENLVLWGNIISIHARGYIDFDRNLDFEVENKISETEEAEKLDWQTTLQEIIVGFGKLMGKARLTGTLENPKWKFQYLGGAQNVLKEGLGKFFKGIFE